MPTRIGRGRQRCFVLGVAVFLGLAGPVRAVKEAAAAQPRPRVLVVALDGVALRVAERVVAEGALDDWSRPVAMVAPFPSMTNVSFANMLGTRCTELLWGYETRYFRFDEASPDGHGHLRYRYSPYAWRDLFDVISQKLVSKAALYATPRKKAWRTVTKIEKLVLESPHEVMLTHVASTDYMSHVSGDEPVVAFLSELAPRLDALAHEHQARYGRPLRVILLSDHGNTNEKAAYTKGLRDTFRAHGFEVTKKLEGPNDLVAPTYGAVNYGAIYVLHGQAERASRAALRHESVALAAWISGDAEATVLSRHGRAKVQWRDGERNRELAYQPEEGDPLRLAEVTDRLAAAGEVDALGFADEDAWLEASLDADYPDAPRRLAESLDGTLVANSAVVILSLAPGYVWGHGFVRFTARLSTGRLEAVHGGLDRVSTLGFYMTNEDGSEHNGAIRSDRVFSDLESDGDCVVVRRDE